MDEIDALIERIRANGHKVWVAGPQSDEAIVELEQTLGVRMPPSFRDFLSRFGGFALGNSFISGIINNKPLATGTGRLYWDTQRFRREYGVPDHLLVVQPDEDAPYCLNMTAPKPDGEVPMVCYELHSRHIGRIAGSFREWFVNWLQLRAENEA
jgi:hypothetical protein